MRAISTFFLLVIMMACSNVDRLDTADIKRKMDNYKIKKVSSAQIMTQLNTRGKDLKNEIEGFGNISCAQARQKVDSLSKVYEVTLELVDISTIDVSQVKNDKEKLLYEAYTYDFRNAKKAAENGQKIDESTYVYSFGLNEQAPTLKCEEMGPHFQYFWKATWTQANLIRSM